MRSATSLDSTIRQVESCLQGCDVPTYFSAASLAAIQKQRTVTMEMLLGLPMVLLLQAGGRIMHATPLSGQVSLELSTDRASYYVGEPVTVRVHP